MSAISSIEFPSLAPDFRTAERTRRQSTCRLVGCWCAVKLVNGEPQVILTSAMSKYGIESVSLSPIHAISYTVMRNVDTLREPRSCTRCIL